MSAHIPFAVTGPMAKPSALGKGNRLHLLLWQYAQPQQRLWMSNTLGKEGELEVVTVLQVLVLEALRRLQTSFFYLNYGYDFLPFSPTKLV